MEQGSLIQRKVFRPLKLLEMVAAVKLLRLSILKLKQLLKLNVFIKFSKKAKLTIAPQLIEISNILPVGIPIRNQSNVRNHI